LVVARRSTLGLSRKKSVTATKCLELGCAQLHRYPDGYCHLHRTKAPVVGEADSIEERWDPTHKTKYFYNKATKKSGWTREEVERVDGGGGAMQGVDGGGGAMQGVMTRTKRAMSGGVRKLMAYASSGGAAGAAPSTAPAATGRAGTGYGKADNIDEKFDPKHQRTYFFNKVTLKSGWTRAEVEETTDWVHSTTGGAVAGAATASQNPLMQNPMASQMAKGR
jgi:hypothetical protein